MDEEARPVVPYGLWPVLSLLEDVLTIALRSGEFDRNMVVANLTQFDEEEMPLVRTVLEELIVATNDVRDALEDVLFGPDHDRPRIEGAHFTEAEAIRRMRRLLDAVASPSQDARAGGSSPGTESPEALVLWSVRQVLSLAEARVCTSDAGEASLRLVSSRVREYGDDRIARMFKATDAVILAAAVVLGELEAMMKPEDRWPFGGGPPIRPV